MIGHYALSHAAITGFDEAVVVSGSRSFNNYALFVELLESWIAHTVPDVPVIFMTGRAASGPDEMIIRWCRQNGRAWTEYPADWEDLGAPDSYIKRNAVTGRLYNARAGHQRNREMARVATRVVCFWDGVSPGTRNMIAEAEDRNIAPTVFFVDRDPESCHGQYGQHGEHTGHRQNGQTHRKEKADRKIHP
ncbi:SLOG family protein [Paraburkholderia adhaesiva]|uniref:SLOG family protein n=1 Tax=Paraburkholderia adhaesiva TaxID=2883244 RepID=UPI001F448918|nr:SLOG family protein [Paraburkholderia adhaesiva]